MVKLRDTGNPDRSPSSYRLSGAVGRIESSMIRDLLALADRPGLISLAGGLPAPESFPVSVIAEAAVAVLTGNVGGGALQYSPTQGIAGLRAWVAGRHGVAVHRVTITSGSQQALDLVARGFVGTGDVAALADPGYVGAIQALRLAGADLLAVPSDGDGLMVDVLEDRLRRGRRPVLVYVVTNFDNPTGATMPAERRSALGGLAERYGFVVVEDDPYGELRWAGSAPPAMATYTERVITLGSFSKILAPGLRVGYVIAPPPVAEALVLLKQPVDLQTATLNQRVVLEVLSRPGFLEAHLARLRALYARRAAALATALHDHFGPGLRFTPADGGLFIWAHLVDRSVDTLEKHTAAIDNGVAYLPGAGFGIDGRHRQELRLSFSAAPADQLDEGVRRLRATLAGPVPLRPRS